MYIAVISDTSNRDIRPTSLSGRAIKFEAEWSRNSKVPKIIAAIGIVYSFSRQAEASTNQNIKAHLSKIENSNDVFICTYQQN